MLFCIFERNMLRFIYRIDYYFLCLRLIHILLEMHFHMLCLINTLMLERQSNFLVSFKSQEFAIPLKPCKILNDNFEVRWLSGKIKAGYHHESS